MAFPYDVAISFAGEDREYAFALARALKGRHRLLVFYDEFEQAWLMGKNLYEYLIDIYMNKAAYCVVLVSEHYREKRWSQHEWKAAQARAFQEPDRDYILPVRLDDTKLPGLLPTTGFIDGRKVSPDRLSELIYEKVRDAAFINDHIRKAERLYAGSNFSGTLEALDCPELEDNIDALRIKADVFGKQARYQEAIECLNKIIAANENDFLANFLLGIFHFRIGNFDEAVRFYEIADRLSPAHPTIATDLPFARKLQSLSRLPIVGRLVRQRFNS